MKSNILFNQISSKTFFYFLLKLVRNKKIILYPVLGERVPLTPKKKFRVQTLRIIFSSIAKKFNFFFKS